jgi:hypothetical protein
VNPVRPSSWHDESDPGPEVPLGLDYPAQREAIIKTAREHSADQGVIDTLSAIPDRSYDGPNAISKELGSG